MTIRKLLKLTVLVACLALLAACSGNDEQEADGKLKVTSTIGMITDVVRNIGGEHVEVTGLMGSGVDPHLYRASQGDIRRLEQADIIFYNGLFLEGRMIEILEKMADDKPSIAVTDYIDRSKLRPDDEIENEYDPHVWFDVSLWMTVTEAIRDTLVEYDPDHAEYYENNAAQYLEQLRELHDEVKAKIHSIPEQGRVLVTAHDAFGYFGDAYNIEVVGLQGMSTASEAGTKDVSDLRDFLIEQQIKAVFIESSVPRRAIDAVIQGAKQLGHTIEIGGELFSDAMGEEGSIEGTYIGMVRHNVNTMTNALK